MASPQQYHVSGLQPGVLDVLLDSIPFEPKQVKVRFPDTLTREMVPVYFRLIVPSAGLHGIRHHYREGSNIHRFSVAEMAPPSKHSLSQLYQHLVEMESARHRSPLFYPDSAHWEIFGAELELNPILAQAALNFQGQQPGALSGIVQALIKAQVALKVNGARQKSGYLG